MADNRTSKAALSAALAAILVLPSLLAAAPAAGSEWRSAKLPYTLRDSTAVYDGKSAYVFGGYSLRNGTEGLVTEAILRFDPASGRTTELESRLPFPVQLADSFWDGTSAYIYGGTAYDSSPLNYLVRFTPPGTVELWQDFFPYALKGTSTVWTGEAAYIFGDCICSGRNDSQKIMRFYPAAMNITVLNASLPFDLAGASAVWTGTEACLFGGNVGDGTTDAILKFDPATGLCSLAQSRLPTSRFKTCAVYQEGKAYILGGRDSLGLTDEVLVYDPEADSLTVSWRRLPEPLACKASCLARDEVLLFGGERAGAPLDRVEILDLKAGSPARAAPLGGVARDIAAASALFTVAVIVVALIWARRGR